STSCFPTRTTRRPRRSPTPPARRRPRPASSVPPKSTSAGLSRRARPQVRVDGSSRLDSAPRGLTARPMAAPQLQALAGSRTRDLGWPAPQEMLARVAILEQAAVFYTLPDPTLRVLARRMRPVTVAAGDTVLHQGEPGDSIFLLSSGRCRVVVERP